MEALWLAKPRIVSVKEKKEEKEKAEELPPVPGEPPWVERERVKKAIEARKGGLPEAAEKIIEEQAKEILPTIPEPRQPLEAKKKKGLGERLFGWIFK